jgi:D-beta-D-heptose 7-phosphate kinase/D-beta-D-heptose 1-phosphate adenosyltransferase
MVAAANETLRTPAPKVEVYDTAGAGDTVIATVAIGIASTGFSREVFELAAQTAACVVRHVGVATPSENDLEAIRAL